MTTPAATEPERASPTSPAIPERPAAGNVVCRNCETLLHGPYCSACGQFDAPPDPSLHEILADAWESLTDLDGKILASLKLLLGRPGALTREYLAGRRARYMPPFRLYFLCSVAFFLIDAVGKPGSGDGAARRPRTAVRVSSDSLRAAIDPITRRPSASDTAVATDPAAYRNPLERGVRRLGTGAEDPNAMIAELVPNAMFVLMPLYASILTVLYRSRRRRYPAHLVFALHAHAFFFATLVIVELGEFLDGSVPVIGSVIDGAAFLWVLAYFPVALRNVYGGGWRPTILRATALGALYSFVGLLLTVAGVLGYLYVLGG